MKPIILTSVVSLFAVVSVHGQTVVFKGSDTLGDKMVPQLIDAYKTDCNCKFLSQVHASGSSDAFTALLDGSAEIGMSSRPIKDSEKSSLAAAGLEVEEHVAAVDMIAVIVNEANSAENVTLDAIGKIFTSAVANWKTVDGGAAVKPYSRNETSGTFKVFQELALGGADYGKTVTKLEGNDQIAERVAAESGAVGYVGLSYARTPGVRALKIDGVAPEATNASTYPLARKLYYYTIKGKLSADGSKFIAWSTTKPAAAEVINKLGFIPTK